jgi:hypothetical protein
MVASRLHGFTLKPGDPVKRSLLSLALLLVAMTGAAVAQDEETPAPAEDAPPQAEDPSPSAATLDFHGTFDCVENAGSPIHTNDSGAVQKITLTYANLCTAGILKPGIHSASGSESIGACPESYPNDKGVSCGFDLEAGKAIWLYMTLGPNNSGGPSEWNVTARS